MARGRRGRPGALLLGADGEAGAPADASTGHPAAGTGVWLSAAPMAEGPAGDEPMGHALAALDARWVSCSATAVAGQEERIRRFARVFLALPASATTGPPRDRQPFGVAARTHRAGSSTFLSLANDTPYPIRLETVLTAPPSAPVDDLGRGLRLAPEAVAGREPAGARPAPLRRRRDPRRRSEGRVGSVTPYPVRGGPRRHEGALRRALRPARPAEQPSRPGAESPGPPNPGFEPRARAPWSSWPCSRGAAPPAAGGSRATRPTPSRSTAQQPHSGRGSLRLDARVPPGVRRQRSLRRRAVQSSLTVQAWLRADRPDARVRVWIEGEAAGGPSSAGRELSAGPDWAATAVRVADLPAGGLDAARLRFELLTPGSLWIDDLASPATTPTEPERLNARSALLAAMHAYREKRYADFARLAGSHWARHAGRRRRRGRAGRRPTTPGCSAPATRLPYRPAACFGKIAPNPWSARGWSPRLAGATADRHLTEERRGRVFVACNTLCFSREPLESALRHIAELEFDKIDLAIVEGSPHLQPVGGGREPRGGPASAPARAEPDARGARRSTSATWT